MTGPRLDPQLLANAISTPRWNVLARTGLDVQTIGTWDKLLHRRKRIVVPVDVQAFVVPTANGEATVEVHGDDRDPAPFTAGTVRPAGVHVHWALPDSLLRGEPTARDANGQSKSLALPALPDRWVVLRLLRPRGVKRPLVRGWVIDAKAKITAPLETFAGTFTGGNPDDVFEPLNAGYGGSLMWTGSYSAASGRFAFHDPLTDVPPPVAAAPNGLADNSAAYVVAGWWTDLALDPLGANAGLLALATRLKKLSWLLDDDAVQAITNAERDRRDQTNASLGLTAPKEGTTVEYAPDVGAKMVSKIYNASAGVAAPVKDMQQMVLATPQPEFATMLHGAVFGVPVSGAIGPFDDRPAVNAVTIALGQDVDDVVAAFGASVLGAGNGNRDAAERLTAAFTSDLLDRIATSDGISDLNEHEHSDGFDSRPGAPIAGQKNDRFIASDAAAANPMSIGRKGRGAAAGQKTPKDFGSVLMWADSVEMIGRTGKQKRRTGVRAADFGVGTDVPPVREVKRPAPREFFAQPTMLALRGVKPNLRHMGDGRFEDANGLRVRYAEECVSELTGAIKASDVLPSLGSGAIPEEVLTIAREAVLLDPYGVSWLHEVITAGLPAEYAKAVNVRLIGEMTRLYGTNAAYDGKSKVSVAGAAAPKGGWASVNVGASRVDRELVAELAAHSIVKGTSPSPVAITTWRQPWVPLWAEWRVVLEGGTTLDGWTLDGLDYTRAVAPPAPTLTRTFTGRAPLGTGIAEAMHAGIKRWLEAEEQRDKASSGVLDAANQKALGELAKFLEPLDMASASLDGIREQLLGIPYMGQMPLDTPPDGVERKPIASELPVPFFGGTLRLDAMRIVDAFGRTLDLDTSRISTTRALEVPAAPSAILLRPRAQHVARWVVRFVGAPDPGAEDPTLRPDAFVDQVTPTAMVNPVAGFLLPDHIDESLEVFATDGTPIGELAHDAITGAVTWEPAPGRPVPPDAGPFTGLAATQSPIAELASGVLLADVAARGSATPPSSSALSSNAPRHRHHALDRGHVLRDRQPRHRGTGGATGGGGARDHQARDARRHRRGDDHACGWCGGAEGGVRRRARHAGAVPSRGAGARGRCTARLLHRRRLRAPAPGGQGGAKPRAGVGAVAGCARPAWFAHRYLVDTDRASIHRGGGRAAGAAGSGDRADAADAAGGQGACDQRAAAAEGAVTGGGLGGAGAEGDEPECARGPGAGGPERDPAAADPGDGAAAALHPSHRSADVARRSDQGGDDVSVPAAPAARGAGGVDPRGA